MAHVAISRWLTLKSAFFHSLPIFSGFIFLGIAYGVYMRGLGFEAWYPIVMALTIFAGSVEFVAAGILLTAFNPLYAFLIVLMISTRQIFYGLSMLNKYHTAGAKKYYLISGMTDESFAINYSAKLDPQIDEASHMFYVTLFLHLFWVMGATIGALLVDVMTVNLTGASFAMTALFLVIFVEQWLREATHESSLIGLSVTLLSLLIFGHEHFLIPAMGSILLILSLRRPALSKKYAEAQQ
ncbi:MAG: AzlC family ABC transporter permease [Acinetobacter sp.]|nr:AzlC family ABC transporter permease [Acinetobacter sp.]